MHIKGQRPVPTVMLVGGISQVMPPKNTATFALQANTKSPFRLVKALRRLLLTPSLHEVEELFFKSIDYKTSQDQ